MKFSEAWLREWVNPPVATEALCEQLTMLGLEVDSIEAVAPPFEGVVVGEVLSVAPHPNAERLTLCQVHTGSAEPLQIICGANNVRAGIKVPTALVGARLPDDLRIRRAKLRGVASQGMLCAATELGLAEQSDGIWILPDEAETGADFRTWLQLSDVSIELGLTPNRGDCLSIEGIAREVGVAYQTKLSGPALSAVPVTIKEELPLTITAPQQCPHYVGRIIEDIDPQAPTPLWMQEKLRRCGLRSLSAIVDVTNYVLLELGQPMHAFDKTALQGGIVVRQAKEGELLQLLNGQELRLTADTLVIADQQAAQALAGIMGGQASAVHDQSHSIFLESAFFNPMSIAGKARAYHLHTDSSHRFERGVDPALQRRALERASQLLLSIAGGHAGPISECLHPEYIPTSEAILIRPKRVHQVLGIAPTVSDIVDNLQGLGMQLSQCDDGWQVRPPSYRFDIKIEADLVEEVGRLIGYDALPPKALQHPMEIRTPAENCISPHQGKQVLVQRGYQEAITYSFVDPALQQQLDPTQPGIPLSNPISPDLSTMRSSLWPGLLLAAQHNLNRQQHRIRFFEYGLRFLPAEPEPLQLPTLAGLASGPAQPEQWATKARAVDFYDLKADVEALLCLGGAPQDFTFQKTQHPSLHPGQAAQIIKAGQPIGLLGQLHPKLQRELGLATPVYLFELHEDCAWQKATLPAFSALSKFPAVRRDLAILLAKEIPTQDITSCIREVIGELLEELLLFDLYTGKGIPEQQKSLAIGLILKHESRTLKEQEIEKLIDDLLAILNKRFNASLRE